MIYNNRNRNNDITESQKEKKRTFQFSQSTLAMLKCDSTSSLHAVQYT